MYMYIANFEMKLGCDDEQLATVVCAQLGIFAERDGPLEMYLLLLIF